MSYDNGEIKDLAEKRMLNLFGNKSKEWIEAETKMELSDKLFEELEMELSSCDYDTLLLSRGDFKLKKNEMSHRKRHYGCDPDPPPPEDPKVRAEELRLIAKVAEARRLFAEARKEEYPRYSAHYKETLSKLIFYVCMTKLPQIPIYNSI